MEEGDGLAEPESVAVGVPVGVPDGAPVGLDVPVGVGVADGVRLGDGLGTVGDGDTGRPVALGVAQAVSVVTGRAEETTWAILELVPACADPDEDGDAAGVHPEVLVGPGDAEPRVPLGPVVAVLWVPVVSAPPGPAGEPWPLVPAPPVGWPPGSTLELTFSIASRSGGTVSVMVATKATPASTATGRSQKVPDARPEATQARPASSHDRQASSHDRGRSAWRGQYPDGVRKPGRGTESGQAQCPRQTQYLARLTAASRTLTSHG